MYKDYNKKKRIAYLKEFQPLKMICRRKQWETDLVGLVILILLIIAILK